MNQIIKIGLLFVTLLSGCGDAGKLMYQAQPSIYMDLPFAKDNAGNDLPFRVDSLTYTFAYEENKVKVDTLFIPVEIEGFRVDKDRIFQVNIVEGTAVENEDYKLLNELCVISANEGKGVIPLVLFRKIELKQESKRIKLELESTSDFQVDYAEMSTVVVSFSDILTNPSWWRLFAWKLGNYHYIKHQEFIRISGLKEFDDRFAASNNYDISYYIGILKQYFIDNERYELEEYPNSPGYPGNRILLP